MHFLNWYLDPLKKYADFNWRASRKEFWLFLLIHFFVYGWCWSIHDVVGVVYSVTTVLPALAVTVRRLHDTNRGGSYLFWSLLPFIGAIVVFLAQVRKGTDGDNDYGPDPLSGYKTQTP